MMLRTWLVEAADLIVSSMEAAILDKS